MVLGWNVWWKYRMQTKITYLSFLLLSGQRAMKETNIERGQIQCHMWDLTTLKQTPNKHHNNNNAHVMRMVSYCIWLAINPTEKYCICIHFPIPLAYICMQETNTLKGSYRDPLRINSSSEEGGLPSIDIFLTLTGQLQLTIVLINIPVDTQRDQNQTLFLDFLSIIPRMCHLSSCNSGGKLLIAFSDGVVFFYSWRVKRCHGACRCSSW